MVVKLGGTALCRQCFKKMLDSGSIALENGEKRSRTAPNSKRPSKFVKAMVLKGGHRFSGYNNVAQLCKQYEMPEMDIEEVDMDDVDNDRESARQVRESVKDVDSISMTKTELKNFVSATTSRRGSTASSAASNPVGNMDAAVMSSMDEGDGEGRAYRARREAESQDPHPGSQEAGRWGSLNAKCSQRGEEKVT